MEEFVTMNRKQPGSNITRTFNTSDGSHEYSTRTSVHDPLYLAPQLNGSTAAPVKLTWPDSISRPRLDGLRQSSSFCLSGPGGTRKDSLRISLRSLEIIHKPHLLPVLLLRCFYFILTTRFLQRAAMGHQAQLALLMLCFTSFSVSVARADSGLFWDIFYPNFGDWIIEYPGDEVETGKEIELRMDNTTGSGFRSKFPYLYGSLGMKIKLPAGDSSGVVSSFYLASRYVKWCELDFEFLGNYSHEPVILQTNVFSEGIGEREQRISLWFDPSEDYHYYGILWNQDLILFLVDDTVIRVFFNSKDLGIPYLDYQPMYIYSSVWNGESWATCGGARKTNWLMAPFAAAYKDFEIDACKVHYDHNDLNDCYAKLYSSDYGSEANRKLSSKQVQDLKRIQYNYIVYDYCTDTERFNSTPPECSRNWPQY